MSKLLPRARFRWLPILSAAALIAVGGVVYASAPQLKAGLVTLAAVPQWYDASPLLVSLRPEARTGLTNALGVAQLEELPLYDLDVSYDPDAASFTLGEQIWFTNRTTAPLTDLVFRIYANAAPPDSGPQVRLVSGSCVDDLRCGVTMASPSAVRVVPGSPIPPHGRLHVKLALTGSLTRIDPSRTTFMAQGLEGMKSILGGGTSGGDYGLLAVGDGIASFASFYAVLARRTPVGWETQETSKLGDLGSDAMANFQARVELPASAKLAVTGRVTSEQPVHASRREVHVAAAAIRDFAFLFADGFEVGTRDVHGVRVRSYFLASDRAEGTKVLDVAAHAFEDFERRFGPYPYADYSVAEAAIVGGAGGVEFSGLVTAASMFYRPTTSASAGQAHAQGHATAENPLAELMAQVGSMGGMGMTDGMLEFVVAHETAHQWWHGLVGSDSRDHPYVDEALAQYSSILYLEDRYGAARAEKDGNANVKMNFQSIRMMGNADAPADQPVAAYTANVQYAGIIYGKAPYFYRAVRKDIGDAQFFSALRSYVAKYRFGDAPARGLVDILAATGGDAKVRPLERRWLDEAHGDEDLGTLDLTSMLGGLMGGAGGAGGLGGLAGLGGGPGGVSQDDLQQVLRMLQGAGGAFPGGGAVGGGGAGGGGAAGPGPTPLLPPGTSGAPAGTPDINELMKALSQ